eukprot:GHRR01024170.1.p1 GENE.GHRR01024170.1~~GHRR01024170.1.p1  ORF type:complete len:410 (-),score=177.90 GHRR01024170.1:2-1231(-)
MLAAPQLTHLLLVIISCIVLFACLANLGVGDRVPYASSYAAAFEETFRALLGLGYVKLADIFPAGVMQPLPQHLLGVIIYYGREMLFVMIFMQYFMATLGGVFMSLKQDAAGEKSSSIGKDISHNVMPEVQAKLKHLLRGPKYSKTARDSNGAAVALPAGAEALYGFIKAHYPQLVASKVYGDRVAAIKVGCKHLDLASLQQLLADLSTGGDSGLHLMQTGPARRFAAQPKAAELSGGDAAAAAAEACDGPARLAAMDSHRAAAAVPGTAGALVLPAAGRAAIAAGAAAPAVAAAMAAADQLMAVLGRAVDAKVLTDASNNPGQIAAGLVDTGAGLQGARQGLEEEVGSNTVYAFHVLCGVECHVTKPLAPWVVHAQWAWQRLAYPFLIPSSPVRFGVADLSPSKCQSG